MVNVPDERNDSSGAIVDQWGKCSCTVAIFLAIFFYSYFIHYASQDVGTQGPIYHVYVWMQFVRINDDTHGDDDHVITTYQRDGLWGSVAKSRHL